MTPHPSLPASVSAASTGTIHGISADGVYSFTIGVNS